MFKDYNRLFIFDTETSSLTPSDGEIIELGGILLSRDDKTGNFSEREDISVLIQNRMPIRNSNIHHITEDMCRKDGITKSAFYRLIKPIFNDEKTLVIAYNAPFDLRFVDDFLKQRDRNNFIKNDILDLLQVARAHTGTRYHNKLCDMLERYNITTAQNSHRALDDCEATLEVMRAMYKEKNDLESFIIHE